MITRHMGAETNKLLTGDYNHVGDTIVYGDTDCLLYSYSAITRRTRTRYG